MKVLVVVDGHLGRTPDGRVWSERIYNYEFFARYLLAFDDVRIAMRIKDIETNESFPNLCSGPHIEFYPIEEFKGPKEYITKYMKIHQNMKVYFDGCDCGIFRIPSTVGYQFLHAFQKTGKPYAVEVVVDPWDFAAPGALKTPLRPIIRLVWTHSLKKDCIKANGVSYVTQYALQKRYPSVSILHGESKEKFDSYYSSVNIPSSYFANVKKYEKTNTPMHIIHVTNYIGNYVKGHQELISAVAELKMQGINVVVDFVGEGNMIDVFQRLAEKKGVGSSVNFIGKLTTPDLVRKALLSSDLFVFPSHAEGLPRVLIEAMAVGLPAVSTNVNGIPELLSEEYLTGVGDVKNLAQKIKTLICDKEAYETASADNLKKALEYSEDILQERRKKFYLKLRLLAE